MKRSAVKWTLLGAALLLVAPGLSTAVSGGFGGLLGYPRYLPGILRVKYDMFVDSRSATICERKPERCMKRVGIDDFHRAFVGNAYTLVRHQNETLIFHTRSYYSFDPPMQHLQYYYMDGHLCSSRGSDIFPGFNCEALIKKGPKYYLCLGRYRNRSDCTELRYISDATMR